MTFEDIKTCYNTLSETQKQLITDMVISSTEVTIYCEVTSIHNLCEFAEDTLNSGVLNDFYESTSYTEDDYKAVINYLKFACEYVLPEVYILDNDANDDIISIDDFDTVPLFRYIDNYSKRKQLQESFFDFVVNPAKHDEPNLYDYNDHFFKDEAEAYIVQHNAEAMHEM